MLKDVEKFSMSPNAGNTKSNLRHRLWKRSEDLLERFKRHVIALGSITLLVSLVTVMNQHIF
jgi:hypothetical protein